MNGFDESTGLWTGNRNGEYTRSLILDYIDRYQQQTGESPTNRQIARACYLARSSVTYALKRLEQQGYIALVPGERRNVRLLHTRKAA